MHKTTYLFKNIFTPLRSLMLQIRRKKPREKTIIFFRSPLFASSFEPENRLLFHSMSLSCNVMLCILACKRYYFCLSLASIVSIQRKTEKLSFSKAAQWIAPTNLRKERAHFCIPAKSQKNGDKIRPFSFKFNETSMKF